MLRVGLTGGLGSGKSTAAEMFAELGAYVLSADAIGRELMQPGQAVLAQVVAAFGPELLQPGGELNRTALAATVFSDPTALQRLDMIIHPAVIAEQERRIAAWAAEHPEGIAIVESALIFEVERDRTAPGWSSRFDRIVLVTASDEIRIARYIARAAAGRALAEQEREQLRADALRRIAAQIPDQQKAAQADFVLTNDGSAEELRAQVHQAWAGLQG